MSVTVSELTVAVASPADAVGMTEVIHAAFGARPPLDPPSTASEETPESVRAALAAGAGVYAEVAGRPAGALVIKPVGPRLASFTRVSVHPEFQRHGIASTMVSAAQDHAAVLGYDEVELFAREEFAELIGFWNHRGYVERRTAPHGVVLGRPLPVAIPVPTAEAMRDLGRRLTVHLRAGDLVIAEGDLGAGKTTLAQGVGAGLGAAGPVISPTFVLSRVHRSSAGRPDLVHVDAYRLSSADELDDLGLDDTMPTAVTVVEWGAGLAEQLATSRLEVDIHRPVAGIDDTRTVLLRGVGERWGSDELAGLRALREPQRV